MSEKELFFENETRKHQKLVSDTLILIATALLERARVHDNSKLEDPERCVFIETTEKLKKLTYGSDEYKQQLADMKVALDHHYLMNRHHPEHNAGEYYSRDIVGSMNLVDIVEMFCDWYAATKRHDDGNIFKSIEVNQTRFGVNEQLSEIFRRTVSVLDKDK